ncbi:precorrin-6y C5,15-methyltransferase (decarboxylating) subunit CbiE [Gymnodinialimonas ceratoperidinii]|uniref:Precorrin-6y C5,15-methyltransferase (Decarboxylating) subunit CbiE n=1 Tax=Gymnodinialimonas ceratoperidinii TaxID=2856823 RepID=A0A8F6TY69_9RHOB|nr:precorrin-6y C5,15-methyltransferase (decarboxylating) subunit CbiE [Gymnodinialimonas ceratoperidinii]QXT41097.1 precorrin-6y C5,15-methyltransferase (decarboxylating) subunit CbiE [Gymnodinialimonas ceratoperidinii]
MAEAPWITIIGLTEDGPEGLAPASARALAEAEIIMGPKRHLGLLPEDGRQRIEWPVPFAEGIEVLAGLRGRQVAVLVSGDPFWYGAGRAISRAFAAEDWRAFPAPSAFSLAAARMAWPLEEVLCIGLHAAPLARLRRELSAGLRAIVLLRDGAAVADLATFVEAQGFGDSILTVCEALGGPRERVQRCDVATAQAGGFTAPVCVALEVAGEGAAIPRASGLPDEMFETDGVMTKRPVRALTLSALAPRAGEHLWDLGGGSGSIAVEWALAHPRCSASVVELREDRVALIRANAERFGVDRIGVHQGDTLAMLDSLPAPHAVFVGGGLSDALLDRLTVLPPGTRLVANGVTLEAEALLATAQERHGGELMRIDLAHAKPLGAKRAWAQAYPVAQWNVVL